MIKAPHWRAESAVLAEEEEVAGGWKVYKSFDSLTAAFQGSSPVCGRALAAAGALVEVRKGCGF